MGKIRILALDGGGIRGIIPATVLQAVEQKLAEYSGRPQARIAEYFDFIAGTSTGGILTCLYLAPNRQARGPEDPIAQFDAGQAVEFYARFGYGIFNASKKRSWLNLRQLANAANYHPHTLKKHLLTQLGDLRMQELLRPCLITTYDMERKAPYFFTGRPMPGQAATADFYVRDIARSTSAAPTYFPPAFVRDLGRSMPRMSNIDGGVFANNPAMLAYAHCRAIAFPQCPYPTAKDMLLLSVGTGGGQPQISNTAQSHRWGLIRWATAVPNIMMDGSADTVNIEMQSLFATLDGELRKNYKRVDVPHDHRYFNSDMADATAVNIQKLKTAGLAAIAQAQQQDDTQYKLDEFIRMIAAEGPTQLRS